MERNFYRKATLAIGKWRGGTRKEKGNTGKEAEKEQVKAMGNGMGGPIQEILGVYLKLLLNMKSKLIIASWNGSSGALFAITEASECVKACFVLQDSLASQLNPVDIVENYYPIALGF
jgi:hypothetical protein